MVIHFFTLIYLTKENSYVKRIKMKRFSKQENYK